VLRFQRAAANRLKEAEFLLVQGGFTTACVYLAGYAVECILKALILFSEPAARNAATLKTFRGACAHDFDWLRVRLAERGVRLSAEAAKELTRVREWTTDLRYDPRALKAREAETFLRSAEAMIRWAKGRM
jgi:HEPN domain-containing protein